MRKLQQLYHIPHVHKLNANAAWGKVKITRWFTGNCTEIYGSSRLGIYKVDSVLWNNGVTPTISNKYSQKLGLKRYELSNHLGNVHVTISDRKIVQNIFYVSDVQSVSDYYPFGKTIPERAVSKNRYDFNGKETDQESGYQDYGFRDYDVEICRFIEVDPLHAQYPWNSTYAFAENTPIWGIDLDGAELQTMSNVTHPTGGKPGSATITITRTDYVVTSGQYAVSQKAIQKFDTKLYHDLWSKGNTTLYAKTLPSYENPAVWLTDKELKQVQRGKANFEYYLIDVKYVFNLVINEGFDASHIKTMQRSLPEGVGFILSNPSATGKLSFMFDEKIAAKVMSKENPPGDYSPTNQYNPIWFNENWLFNTEVEGVKDKATGNVNTKYLANETEVLVHSAGHNSTNYGHGVHGYGYDVPGLSSKYTGEIYPTQDNTKAIINENGSRQLSYPK